MRDAAPPAPVAPPASSLPECERCHQPSPDGVRCYPCLAGEVEQLRFEAERTAIQTPPALSADVRTAAAELHALANLIERPPLDDVQLEQGVALRSAAAIRTVLASLATPTPARPDAGGGEAAIFVQHLRNRADSRDQMGYDATADQIRQAADMIESLATSTPDAVAEAVAAETERCARIADGNRIDDGSMWDCAAETIAAAIRQPRSEGGS